MNLTNAESIFINNKEVNQISIDGNIVYVAGRRIRLSADKSFIVIGETVTLTVNCDDLPHTQIELYDVINMTRTLIDTLETDENGQASYTYTGVGDGRVGFVAVYDETESNTVVIDDYIPVPVMTPNATSINTVYGNSREFSVVVKDQHGVVMVGETVSFYDGDTYLSSGTTNSNGRAYISLSTFDVGEYTLTAHLDGIISQSCAVTISKADTWLGIDTPTLVYSDMFDVNGTLKRLTSSGVGVVGETVTLHWKVGDGAEQTATAETTTGGAFNFHKGPVASMSSYKFWITYDGGVNYNGSTSSELNVDPDKETTVLNITSPASGAVVSTDSVTVTGNVKDNDGTPLTGEKVYFLLNNSSNAGYDTLRNNGSFTKTVTRLSAGSNSIMAIIQESTTHTAATQSITVNRSTFDGLADIELIDGSQILSYADEQQDPYSQYATLETQLMNGDSPAAISGVTVQFWDFTDESSPLYLGEGDTDSNGKASYTYYSTGAGDVPIKAVVGSLLTKTYGLEDCVDVITGETDQSSKFGSSIRLRDNGVGNVNYDSTNQYYILNITTNGEVFAPINSANGLNDFIIEFDGNLPFNVGSGRGSLIGLTVYSDTNNWGRLGAKVPAIEYGSKVNGSYSETDISSTSTPQSTWIHYKFTITNSTVKRQMYNGNTLIYEDTKSYSSSWFTSSTKYGIPILYGTSWKAYFKNLKIKPL